MNIKNYIHPTCDGREAYENWLRYTAQSAMTKTNERSELPSLERAKEYHEKKEEPGIAACAACRYGKCYVHHPSVG